MIWMRVKSMWFIIYNHKYKHLASVYWAQRNENVLSKSECNFHFMQNGQASVLAAHERQSKLEREEKFKIPKTNERRMKKKRFKVKMETEIKYWKCENNHKSTIESADV